MTEFMNLNIDQNIFDYQPESVAGKSIVITGGTTGIGRATAILLASQGAKVLILGRHEKELNDALEDIRKTGGEVIGITADTSGEEGITTIYDQVDQQLGGIDVLINNAALGYKDVQQGSYADWEYVVHTNLLGYMAMASFAVERMKSRGKGHIVNIGSMSADVREKGSSVYVATKAGIQGFSEALRKEVNAQGIKVTLIEPGAVGTDMQPQDPEEQRKQEAEMKMMKAEDIAACVLYTLIQPRRVDVVVVQIRPHLQEI